MSTTPTLSSTFSKTLETGIPLNILLYTPSFLPRGGGLEVVNHYLASCLQELGHNVRVVMHGGWRQRNEVEFSYPVTRLPTARGLLGETDRLATLWVVARFHQADVIHAHDTTNTGFVAAKLKRFFPAPLVITPHGEDINTVPEIGYGFMLDDNLRPRIEYAVRNANALTAISHRIEQALKSTSDNKVPVYHIPNGVDNRRFSGPVNPSIRAKYGIPPDARVILTVGHQHQRRGYEHLIRAVANIVPEIPEVFLVLVGRRTESLADECERNGVSSRVLLAGRIMDPAFGTVEEDPKDDLADLYREAEVYASASMAEGAEGMSLALLDAMAASKCIVASRISGTQDVLNDGVNGILVEPGDSEDLTRGLRRALTDSNLAQSVRERAGQTARAYDWMDIARRYVAVYESVADRIRSP